MTEHAWFKLLIRAIGIMLCGFALPAILGQAGYLLQSFASTQSLMPLEYIWMSAGSALGTLAEAGIGLYLLFGGNWIISRCLKEIRDNCVSCGYDISASVGDTCSECGAPILRSSGHSAPKPPAPPQPDPHP